MQNNNRLTNNSPERDKWVDYQEYKNKLARLDLSPEEYQAAVKQYCDEHGL